MKNRLLYVDDEGSNLRVFKSAFRRDYDVFIALSVKEGIKILEEQKIDVILSDQRMPDMTGVDFLQFAAHHSPDAVRILVTGFADFDAMKDAINKTQIAYYIQKPWDEVALAHVIENTLKIKNLENENYKQKRELLTTAVQISKTGQLINSTINILNNLLKKHTDSECCKDIIALKNHMKSHAQNHENWEAFNLRFTEVHPDFLIKLKKAHPKLTQSELKFSSYLRIHLSSTQIMSALNVSKEAIRKTRYRLRKKIDLQPEDSLEDYISKF
ncbi:response regulator [Lentimicrobium sp. S6]|uniref:response regulator n=1 Tax=Lentimicrobium sp. S6 TaxID=2735872 RepID=UPI001552F1C5|nr:response regulator [Lentimicrobium sp. S6]NPD47749.1 response regulator [Lentimicrobium sp. S6]